MYLNEYFEPIKTAFIIFPFVALLLTTPYCIVQYRKNGSVSALKQLIVFSFILYMMAAYFLIILPLPSRKSVLNHKYSDYILLKPLNNLIDYVKSNNPSFKELLKSSVLFQYAFNIVLTIPFGIYIRYFMKSKKIWKVIFFSFCLSLFFEITQLSGLYGIYKRPYRFFDVDDLICNTLGGFIGGILCTVICRILPSIDELNMKAKKHSVKVSFFRRVCGTLIDYVIIGIIIFIINSVIFVLFKSHNLHLEIQSIIVTVIYFLLFAGNTLGKRICRIKVITKNGKSSYLHALLRYFILYGCVLYMPLYERILSQNKIIKAGSIYSIIIYLIFMIPDLILFLDCIRVIFTKSPLLYELISGTLCKSTAKES